MKHISCKWGSKSDSKRITKIKIGITVSVNVSAKIQLNIVYAKRILIRILAHALVRLIFKRLCLYEKTYGDVFLFVQATSQAPFK